MKLKTAGELMIPLDKYPHIPHWFSLRQAIAELESTEVEVDGRSSVPRLLLIFDERYQLMGVLRQRDILRGLEPKFLNPEPLDYRKKLFDVKADPDLAILSPDRTAKGIQEQAEQPVSELMIPFTTTIGREEGIFKAIHLMEEENLGLIPVLDEGRVVGVVRAVEILHELAQVVL